MSYMIKRRIRQPWTYSFHDACPTCGKIIAMGSDDFEISDERGVVDDSYCSEACANASVDTGSETATLFRPTHIINI